MRMSRSEPLLVGRYSPVGGEAQVVVLPVQQPASEGVVLAHHCIGPCCSVGEADLCCGAVKPHLLGEGIGVDGAGGGGDRLGHQFLQGGERVGGLAGPAPLVWRRGVGDGG